MKSKVKKDSRKPHVPEWLEEAMTFIVGKQVKRYRYKSALRKRGAFLTDVLTLQFDNGTLTIEPDPTGKNIELNLFFTPSKI